MDRLQLEAYRRVVVPLDGSEEAEAVLPAIIRLARPLGIEVALVRVVPAIPTTAIEGAGRTTLHEVTRVREEAESYLADVCGRWCAAGLRVTTTVRAGDPAREIVAVARDGGADLIAMTTHGRTGLGRILFGSVAEEVLRTADVPVLAVRLAAAKAARHAA
jgi:nucleotide-binding universal stress UspA family protein